MMPRLFIKNYILKTPSKEQEKKKRKDQSSNKRPTPESTKCTMGSPKITLLVVLI
jgi:hypothetical protein